MKRFEKGKQVSTEEQKDHNRRVEYMRRLRKGEADPTLHIIAAYAERFRCAKKCIIRIGTEQLSLCRSDEARRILIHAQQMAIASAKKANKASNIRRKKVRHSVERLVALAFRETRKCA